MVSIQQLEKKNKLSAELKKHGFAVDNSQAFEQAEKIYNKNKAAPEVAFADEQQVLIMEPKAENDLQELKDRISVLERQKAYAEQRAREKEEKLDQVTSKINEIVKSINLIEKNQQAFSRKLSGFKKPEKNNGSGESSSSNSGNDPNPKSSGESTSNESSPNSNPKDGEYTPDDVAVDKIFYSGQK